MGKDTAKIEEYIRRQVKEYCMADQISLKEFIDLFTANPEVLTYVIIDDDVFVKKVRILD